MSGFLKIHATDEQLARINQRAVEAGLARDAYVLAAALGELAAAPAPTAEANLAAPLPPPPARGRGRRAAIGAETTE